MKYQNKSAMCVSYPINRVSFCLAVIGLPIPIIVNTFTAYLKEQQLREEALKSRVKVILSKSKRKHKRKTCTSMHLNNADPDPADFSGKNCNEPEILEDN